MPHDLDPDHLQKVTAEMIETITSPAFVEAMRKMKAAPADQKLSEGARLLNPDTLRKAGVPLPDGMRITSRYFEPGSEAIDVNAHGAFLATDPANPLRLAAQAGVCACGGAATVCGGAGN
jgi:hypothetical protein